MSFSSSQLFWRLLTAQHVTSKYTAIFDTRTPPTQTKCKETHFLYINLKATLISMFIHFMIESWFIPKIFIGGRGLSFM